MRIAQILNNKAHWIFEAETMPQWPPDSQGNPILLVDVTELPQVQEGWIYENGVFSEPVVVEVPTEPTPPIVYQPSNAELAQQVEDLRIDLICAGVI